MGYGGLGDSCRIVCLSSFGGSSAMRSTRKTKAMKVWISRVIRTNRVLPSLLFLLNHIAQAMGKTNIPVKMLMTMKVIGPNDVSHILERLGRKLDDRAPSIIRIKNPGISP